MQDEAKETRGGAAADRPRAAERVLKSEIQWRTLEEYRAQIRAVPEPVSPGAGSRGLHDRDGARGGLGDDRDLQVDARDAGGDQRR